MQSSRKNLFNPFFSHIYLEKKAKNHPNTQRILSHFSKAKIIEINHYKDVFSRNNQNFSLQKKSFKLILAIKEENLIYRGSEVCQDFDHKYFYYTSTMMNCIYDCQYCYLQGMYNTANIVLFVNIEDILYKVEELLKKHPLYLCISYDTDILALENIVGYGRRWIEFASKHQELMVELRTKSTNFNSIEDIKPQENIILAWTLSPDKIIKEYENKTPVLKDRLLNIRRAMDKGWKVRLCFDPILYIKDWKENYKDLIETTFIEIQREKIYDVSIGVFRVSKDYLKKMRKHRPESVILNYPFETAKGICSYEDNLAKDMLDYVYNRIKKYVPEEKIWSFSN